jgi:hypothetical protein
VANVNTKFDSSKVTVTSTAPAPTAPSTGGIAVQPGQSIQAVVDANPAGTTLLIKTGIHRRQSVLPKHGNTFVCEAGAVLDGEGATAHAFRSVNGDPDNVTIRGCRITRYAPPVGLGAVLAGAHGNQYSTTGWLIESCEIDNNTTGGIRLGFTTVRKSHIHHNGLVGLLGGGAPGKIVIDSNEIAYNNPSGTGIGHESGGTKFVGTDGLVVRGNFVHHNKGPGLWTDINNIRTLYEGNLVEDNTGAGIAHETSYDAVIRNNVLRRNGFGLGWIIGAGIEIAGSPNVEVYGNTLEGNRLGIFGVQQARGSGQYGPYHVRNLNVHNNTVRSSAVYEAGLGADDGSPIFSAEWNNRFTGNSYQASCTAARWSWNGLKSFSQWRTQGKDQTGTCVAS